MARIRKATSSLSAARPDSITWNVRLRLLMIVCKDVQPEASREFGKGLHDEFLKETTKLQEPSSCQREALISHTSGALALWSSVLMRIPKMVHRASENGHHSSGLLEPFSELHHQCVA